MINCEECQALIDAYLDGELTREATKHFEAHISSCNECSEALLFAKSIRNTLSTLPEIDIPEDFGTKLRQRIDAECKTKKGISIYVRRYGMLAAGIILAVVVGSSLGDIDFTKSGPSYDNNIIETAPKTTDNIISGQNAGETTPTEDKEKTTNIATPKPASVKPEPTDNTSGESVTASVPNTDTEPVSDASQEHLPDVAALYPEEVPSPTPQTDDGSSSFVRTVDTETENVITLMISSDYSEVALGLIKEFATDNNGVYSADKTAFDSLLNSFDIGGIPYTVDGTADGEVVTFTVSIK